MNKCGTRDGSSVMVFRAKSTIKVHGAQQTHRDRGTTVAKNDRQRPVPFDATLARLFKERENQKGDK